MRFTGEALGASQAALDRLRRAYASWPEGGVSDAGFVARFDAEVNNDLNLPRALAVLWELVRSGLSPATRRATADAFDAVLGMGLAEWRADEALVPMDIAALAEERRRARAAGDWAEADALRATLRTLGWEVEDGEQGQRLVRAQPRTNASSG